MLPQDEVELIGWDRANGNGIGGGVEEDLGMVCRIFLGVVGQL
jgi:hypothetical protein